MRQVGKYVKISFKIVLVAIIVFLLCTTVYHHLRLSAESKLIQPVGQIVTVNSSQMHVYREGEELDNPTLVFMSGYSTVAPVYNFKPLYSSYEGQYPIAVVEKAGYGYSEKTKSPRDLDTMLEETREALKLAGSEAPYILFPHSISGLEAIYWAEKYPDEVLAIVGLDMDFPKAYDAPNAMDFNMISGFSWVADKVNWLGLLRLSPNFGTPDIIFSENIGLSAEDIQQQKYLMYKNMFNQQFVTEGFAVNDNLNFLKKRELPQVPCLFFVSDGREIGDYWVSTVEEFTEEFGAELIYFESGHFVQNNHPNEIYEHSVDFFDRVLIETVL